MQHSNNIKCFTKKLKDTKIHAQVFAQFDLQFKHGPLCQYCPNCRGFEGPGPGSQTRVLGQIGPADPGPLRPGVSGISASGACFEVF